MVREIQQDGQGGGRAGGQGGIEKSEESLPNKAL